MVLDPKRRARWWGLVVLVALVGSLLLGPSLPVAGAGREATHPAVHSACVGPAIDPAGFSDVARYPAAAQAAINCLAHYGITQGTATGGFDPEGEVTRWQMALFLVRAAGPAGIVVPRPSDQGLEDIGGLAGNIGDAINQLADLGITTGTTKSTFSPHSLVTRRQMAEFLARFLEAAPVGPGGVDIDDVKHDENDPHFQDVTHLRRDVHEMIAKLFEMGVTTGTSSRQFSPDEPVRRAQMALFITRALAHTNARPAGITVQTGPTTVTSREAVDLMISVRDSAHRPVPGAPVDLFYAASREDALGSGGECTRRAMPEFGGKACVIDLDDETADGDGNLLYYLIVDEDFVLWAWTGDPDDEFDLDKTGFASEEFTAFKPVTGILLTDNLHPEAIKVPYGRSVTFTFQLVDADEDPVAQENVVIRVRTKEERGRERIRPQTNTYFTDESGKAQFNYVVDKHESDDDDDGDTYLTIEVLESSDLEIIDKSAVGVLGGEDQGDPNPLPWSDEEGAANALALELSIEYHVATDYGRGGRTGVTAMLVDQYGDPVRGGLVHFKSNDEAGLWHDPGDPNLAKRDLRDLTDRNGEATLTYSRDSDESGIEIIEASVANEDIQAEPVEHYWVLKAPDDGDLHFFEVLIHDEDRHTLVLQDSNGDFFVVKYDRNDRFYYDGVREHLKTFAEGLGERELVEMRIQSHHPNLVNRFERY